MQGMNCQSFPYIIRKLRTQLCYKVAYVQFMIQSVKFVPLFLVLGFLNLSLVRRK